MICQRCQRSLRSNDGLKCNVCESKYHVKCASKCNKKDFRDSGDRGYQWQCAICHNSVNKAEDSSKENLLNAINILTEKFESVYEVQLPQLSSELTQIKSVTDRIVKQNDDLLRKIDEFGKKSSCETRSCGPTRSYRKRSLNFSHRSGKCVERNDYMPLPSQPTAPQKTLRYHTRRRSYLINSMFHLLNRNTNVTTPRKRH